MDASLQFFSRADAVIALLDPMTVSAVRHMLADIVPGDGRLGGDGADVIRHVLGMMTGHAAGARTSIPMAVVLSKFDVLQVLRKLPNTWGDVMNRSGSPLQRDPSLTTPFFDQQDGDLLHAEVHGLLQMLGSHSLVSLLDETALRYRLFASSALGASAEGQKLSDAGIAPFRVLDPFKWALEVTR
jgi:hypothetical protein